MPVPFGRTSAQCSGAFAACGTCVRVKKQPPRVPFCVAFLKLVTFRVYTSPIEDCASSARLASRNMARPLRGLRVLDLGNFLAGPVVSMHLGAMGADVIKLERITGDDSRAIGPMAADGESSYFMSVNRGKRSVAVDTRTAPGKQVLKALARRSDVLVENFRPGVMDRLGVGYDVLSQENPRLIYASVSGFGPEGPHAARPAFDSLLQAAGGLVSVTGSAEAGQPPVRVGCSIVDMCSGLHTTIGILAALHQVGVRVRVRVS